MAFLLQSLFHLTQNKMPEINKCFISQGFAQNANPLYASAGQKGHTGVDEVCGYGTPVYALKKGWVYKILDDKRPALDGSGYWGVFIISEDGGLCEWQVGHLSKILCKVGDQVEPWTIIGEEGNKGGVYAGGIQITKEMQDAGDRRGSHRHWNKKLLKKRTYEQRDVEGGQYLTVFSPSTPTLPDALQDGAGFFYQVQDYKNGYNGSVDCLTDIDAGYKAINEHNNQVSPEVEKVVTDGIKVVTWAMKYPALYGFAMKILQGLAALIGKR